MTALFARSDVTDATDASDWRCTGRLVRARWHGVRDRSVVLGITAAALIVLFAAMRMTPRGAGAVLEVGGLRPDLGWGPWMLRLPLSVFTPAPRLPIWGAVVQVVVVVGLAELIVGRRRVLAAAAIAHTVPSLIGRIVVANPDWSGSISQASLLDSGPSAAVMGLAVAVAVASRLRLATAIAGLVAVHAVLTPSLATIEHIAAVAVGLAIGWVWRRSNANANPSDAPCTRLSRSGRSRRVAAATVAVAGVLNLLSVPLGGVLRGVVGHSLGAWPFTVGFHRPGVAVVMGVMLLIAGRGIRRGQRIAWAMTIALGVTRLVSSARSGSDVVEATLTLLFVMFLIVERRSFGAPARLRSTRRGLAVVAGGLCAVAGGALLITRALIGRGGYRRMLLALFQRTVGIESVTLPAALDRRMEPWLGLAGAAFLGTALWLVTRPAGSHAASDSSTRDKASACVRRWGSDTLAWFALRHDKDVFFAGASMVTYSVKGSTALVSPDPIGPVEERDEIWRAFRAFANDNGWSTVVLGASADWLPTYLSDDLHVVYIGDEAIVDITTFSLEGGKMKGLRQAAARAVRNGYRVSFHDPSELDSALACELRQVGTLSRQGASERGYSMTLGRFFDPGDHGMLVAICHDRTDRPVAFCTFVPAAGIGGWSLDAMRRDPSDHPNGLLDFVIVETIAYLRDQGNSGLCLNFAAMRSVLANERDFGRFSRIVRWSLRRGTASMQVESLWRYNAKFYPEWRARYAVFETLADVPDALVAVARAESVWEIPLVGRFLIDRKKTLHDTHSPALSPCPKSAAFPRSGSSTAEQRDQSSCGRIEL